MHFEFDSKYNEGDTVYFPVCSEIRIGTITGINFNHSEYSNPFFSPISYEIDKGQFDTKYNENEVFRTQEELLAYLQEQEELDDLYCIKLYDEAKQTQSEDTDA